MMLPKKGRGEGVQSQVHICADNKPKTRPESFLVQEREGRGGGMFSLKSNHITADNKPETCPEGFSPDSAQQV